MSDALPVPPAPEFGTVTVAVAVTVVAPLDPPPPLSLVGAAAWHWKDVKGVDLPALPAGSMDCCCWCCK